MISALYLSVFVEVMFHIVLSAGSLISREASTVLVEREKIIAAVPNVLVVFYHLVQQHLRQQRI